MSESSFNNFLHKKSFSFSSIISSTVSNVIFSCKSHSIIQINYIRQIHTNTGAHRAKLTHTHTHVLFRQSIILLVTGTIERIPNVKKKKQEKS